MEKQLQVWALKGKSTPTLSIFDSRTSLPRAIGNPTDSLQLGSHAIGQPLLIGTPLIVWQQIKITLSTAKRFCQNLNLMYGLLNVI